MPQTKISKVTYRRTSVHHDPHALEVLVEIRGQVHVDLASADDEVVGSRLNKVHQLERMRFDLVCVQHVPHEVAIRKDDHTAGQPVVVHQELAILHPEHLHSKVTEGLTCGQMPDARAPECVRTSVGRRPCRICHQRRSPFRMKTVCL